jgi:O-antigen ligase
MLSVLSMFAIGVWFALKRPMKDRAYLLVVLTLTGGLLATYGRGPILAGLLLFASAWMLKRMTAKRYLVVVVIGAIIVGAGWSAGIGDAVTTLLGSAPGADETADFNVRYRQELLTMSLALLKQSPWWGVPNFLEQLAVLKQGEGIIDLVNTYLVLALNSGTFGLGLVMLPYIVSLWREASRTVVNLNIGREGYAWLALTVAFMAAIFTVSPVSIIQILMVWIVAVALARLQDGNARVAVTSEESPRAPVQAQVQFGFGR